MSSADDRRGALESQAGETDSRNGKWKSHRVRAGSHNWEGDELPTDAGVHRKHVEPWLAALLQAEHVNLLVGSGLTTAVTTLAGAPAIDMKASTFACDLADAVDRAAKDSAERCGRGEPNLEDQIRAARELIAGLRILTASGGEDQFATRASELLAAWETALDERLRKLLQRGPRDRARNRRSGRSRRSRRQPDPTAPGLLPSHLREPRRLARAAPHLHDELRPRGRVRLRPPGPSRPRPVRRTAEAGVPRLPARDRPPLQPARHPGRAPLSRGRRAADEAPRFDRLAPGGESLRRRRGSCGPRFRSARRRATPTCPSTRAMA